MSVSYDEVLLTGTPEELAAYAGDTGKCIVVDHREEEESILQYVQEKLPEGILEYEWNEEGNDLLISYQGQTVPVGLTFSPRDRYITIRKLNEVLGADYELRVFNVSLDWDTHSLYLQPVSWWAAMDKQFPERMNTVFSKITPKSDFFQGLSG